MKSGKNDDSNIEIIEEKLIGIKGDEITLRYYKGRLLGKGGFGKCFELTCTDNNKIYACKIIDKYQLKELKDKKKIIREIKIHKSLNHPNIVGFEHFFEDKNNIYILLEMCANNTLRDLIKKRKYLTELEVQCYMVQLIKALKYIHSQKVIHRDIKLSNIFLTDKMELKIGDFGLAVKLSYQRERRNSSCGTINYMAPEIINKYEYNGHSYEVDVWSLGIVMYVLLVGRYPFYGENSDIIYNKILQNSYTFPQNKHISNSAKNLITQIFVVDPDKRPTLDQILTHDFFYLGYNIPKLLPISTLSVPPTIDYIRQFMPDINDEGIINKKVIATNLKQHFNINIDSPLDLSIETRKKLINYVDPDEILEVPELWITNWVDFSSKYGLGYSFNNGNFGVFFNDFTKLIVDSKTNKIYYIKKYEYIEKMIYSEYTFDEYPKEIEQKIFLLNHFKNFIVEHTIKDKEKNKDNKIDKNEINDEKDVENEKNKDENKSNNESFIFVKKWTRTNNTILFIFNNNNIQVIFKDKTELFLFNKCRFITYINEKKEKKTYLLNNILYADNNELQEKLKYVKNIMTQKLISFIKKFESTKNENEEKGKKKLLKNPIKKEKTKIIEKKFQIKKKEEDVKNGDEKDKKFNVILTDNNSNNKYIFVFCIFIIILFIIFYIINN